MKEKLNFVAVALILIQNNSVVITVILSGVKYDFVDVCDSICMDCNSFVANHAHPNRSFPFVVIFTSKETYLL